MVTYLLVRFYDYASNGGLTLRVERLPFRKANASATFPSDGPSVMPADIHDRGTDIEWARLTPGHTAWYAGVRYVDLADWCRKWGLEPVALDPV